MLRRWRGQIVQEGVQTGDGRIIEPGALSWETPMPFAWMVGGTQHIDMASEAPTIGIVETIERDEATGWLNATGIIDDAVPAGAEMIRQLETGSASLGARMGVSVDMDDMAMKLIDTRPPEDADDEDGLVIVASASITLDPTLVMTATAGPAQADIVRGVLVSAAGDPIDEDGEVLFEDSMDELVMQVTRARVRGLTAVATPAFADAWVELDGDAEPAEEEEPEDIVAGSRDRVTALIESSGGAGGAGGGTGAMRVGVAGGGGGFNPSPMIASTGVLDLVPGDLVPTPLRPPADWFGDPLLEGPLPLTIDDDGRVYGHIAAWGTCHTGYDRCVTPPRGGDYSTFMSVGRVTCEDDIQVSTGALVWGTQHADLSLSLLAAFAHYEVASHGFADVRVGEDEHGIWMAGALRPHVTFGDLRTLQALSVSGDWRQRQGRLDMIAALAVNVPGFPVQSDSGMVAAGIPQANIDHDELFALVAAGVVPNEGTTDSDCGCGGVTASGVVPPWAARLQRSLDVLEARTRTMVPDALAAAASKVPARR